MAEDKKSMQIDKSVHKRLSRYGHLHETFSMAIDRAMDEADFPPLEELEDGR